MSSAECRKLAVPRRGIRGILAKCSANFFFSIFEINLNLKFITFPGPNYRYKMQTTYLSYLCHLHVHTEEANYGINSGKKFTNIELKYNFFSHKEIQQLVEGKD